MLAALLLASQLRPDPRGFGTHEQLGLPPCTVSLLFGIRCPACGMTTAWASVTHGQLREAWRANAVGALLAVAAVPAAAAALAMAARGKTWNWQPGEKAVAFAALACTGLMILEWMLRLAGRW